MAVSILTEDLLRLCLVAAHGDLETTLDQVLGRLERFQRRRQRRFGVCRSDLRSAFGTLVLENRNLLGLVELRVRREINRSARASRRPADKAHRRRNTEVFQGDATQTAGMDRRPEHRFISRRTLNRDHLERLAEVIDRLPLHRTLLLLLKYADLYCNDEGEHWCISRPRYERPRSADDRKLRRFFLDPRNHRSCRVRALMDDLRLDEAVWMRLSYPDRRSGKTS